MKRLAATLAVIAAVLFSAVGCHRAEVIPEATMSDIYADMFLADQWLNSNGRYRRNVDTMWFYRPIFEKYGYTYEDYDLSVTYYLRKPDTYSKILKGTMNRLDKEYNRLKKIDDILASRRKWEKFKAPKLPILDSLAWASDTTIRWSHYIEPVVEIDTVTLDSLALDSLLRDSLKLDSLRRDSLLVDSLVVDSLKVDTLAKNIIDSTIIKTLDDESERKAAEMLLIHGSDNASLPRYRGVRKGLGKKGE